MIETDDDVWNLMGRVHEAAMNAADEAIYDACMIDVEHVVNDRTFCEELWQETLNRELADVRHKIHGIAQLREVFIVTFQSAAVFLDIVSQEDYESDPLPDFDGDERDYLDD